MRSASIKRAPEEAPVWQKLKHLPDAPGVYQFRNASGDLLYIGKAKVLRNRIRSYFQKSTAHNLRIQIMVSLVVDVTWILTDTEAEALLLEEQLIKLHKPRYNVALKDDKSYPYLKLSVQEHYPRLSLVRERHERKAEYFGPYPSAQDARHMMRVALRYFPLRTSKMELDGSKIFRPCLNFQLKRCLAPCRGNVAVDEYGKLVRQVRLFLKGRDQELLQDLERRMQSASETLEFEQAAQLRDQIQSLQRIFTRQTVMSPDGEDRDVFNLYREAGTAGVQVLFIRNGRLLGSDFFFFDTSEQASDANLLGQAINRLYTSEMTGIPRQVLLPFEYPEEEILGDALSEQAGHRVQLMFPKRGHKKELVSLAFQNARANLEEQRRRVVKDSEILRQVQNFLHLKQLPDRVECFDISHFSGEMTVASMVCWEGNKPAKENYRKYKLRTIHSPDDFASMEEVLTRRYQRALSGQQPLPDLIIIDGGKGQLNAALAVLEKLGIDWNQQDIIGLAKGRSERRRGVTRGNDEDYEYVVKPNQKNEIRLQRYSSVLYFLQNIRDEAHRFAIEFQRKLKRQDNLKSLLDEIPGVGNRRKRALLKHFGSLKRVREASVEELRQVSGISPVLAEEIVRFFKECDSFLKKKYAASQKES